MISSNHCTFNGPYHREWWLRCDSGARGDASATARVSRCRSRAISREIARGREHDGADWMRFWSASRSSVV